MWHCILCCNSLEKASWLLSHKKRRYFKCSSVRRFRYFDLGEGFFTRKGLSKKNAVKPRDIDNNEVKIYVEGDQKLTAIHQTNGHKRLVGRGPLCVNSRWAVSVLMSHVHTYCHLWRTLLHHATFFDMQNLVLRMAELNLKCNEFNVTGVGYFFQKSLNKFLSFNSVCSIYMD